VAAKFHQEVFIFFKPKVVGQLVPGSAFGA